MISDNGTRIVTVVALVAALGLAGCGRKSALEAPPGGAVVPRNLETTPQPQSQSQSEAQPLAQPALLPPNDYDPKVLPPATAMKRPIPVLDWLIQ